MAKKSKTFQHLMQSLQEVVDWNKGEGKMRVTMPGEKPRMMTRDEYEAAQAAKQADDAPKTP